MRNLCVLLLSAVCFQAALATYSTGYISAKQGYGNSKVSNQGYGNQGKVVVAQGCGASQPQCGGTGCGQGCSGGQVQVSGQACGGGSGYVTSGKVSGQGYGSHGVGIGKGQSSGQGYASGKAQVSSKGYGQAQASSKGYGYSKGC